MSCLKATTLNRKSKSVPICWTFLYRHRMSVYIYVNARRILRNIGEGVPRGLLREYTGTDYRRVISEFLYQTCRSVRAPACPQLKSNNQSTICDCCFRQSIWTSGCQWLTFKSRVLAPDKGSRRSPQKIVGESTCWKNHFGLV